MSRQTFMRELETLLQDIPEHDRLDAVAYYNDYFDEAGEENEERILRELGSPKKVADSIKENVVYHEDAYGEETPFEFSEKGCTDKRSAEEWKVPMKVQKKAESESKEKSFMVSNTKAGIPWFVIVLLLIFAAPVLIGIIGGLFGGLIGLIGGLFGVTIGTAGSGFGLFIGGLVCFVTGFARVFSNPMEGLTSMGVGALLISVGILLVLLFVVLIKKWIPALAKGFIGGCKYVYRWAMSLIRGDEV